MDISLLYDLILAFFFLGLTLILGYQMIQHGALAKTLLLSMTYGTLGAFFALFNELDTIIPIDNQLLLTLQLSCYGIQYYYWYLHLEQTRTLHVHQIRFAIVVSFLVLEIISLWFIYFFQKYPNVTDVLWLFADISYDGLAIFTFMGFGVWISVQTWHYSKDKKMLYFIASYFLVGFGFCLILIIDLTDFLISEGRIIFGVFDEIAYAVPVIGLLMLFFLYIRNINYLYRTHFDVFTFILASKSKGEVLQTYQIKAKNPIHTDPTLVTGFLMGVTGLFGEIFDRPKEIRHIQGSNANLVLTSGNSVIAMLLTERISNYLVHSLKQFVKVFEYSMNSNSNIRMEDIDKQSVYHVFQSVFPFFSIEFNNNDYENHEFETLNKIESKEQMEK